MKILISNTSDSPLYQQIKDQIKDAVLKEELSDGELRETQTANYFSDIYPIDSAVLSANAQSCRKCSELLSAWIPS